MYQLWLICWSAAVYFARYLNVLLLLLLVVVFTIIDSVFHYESFLHVHVLLLLLVVVELLLLNQSFIMNYFISHLI